MEKMRENNLVSGDISKGLLQFAGPMIVGNIMQQAYSLADTIIVGNHIGEDALAAVGSTYTLTTFLYSVIIGLCMGCGSLVSYMKGQGESGRMRSYMDVSLLMIGLVAVFLETVTLTYTGSILEIFRIPKEIFLMTRGYVIVILTGIFFVFLYNYYAYVLRGSGDSKSPLIFLGISSALNIILDIVFVVHMNFGVKGAAYGTLISQMFSGIGLMLYSFAYFSDTRPHRYWRSLNRKTIKEVLMQSGTSGIQQSVMNFGILMIQGLVNSFGTVVMAAFTVGVKIDTLAYMPAQEFGNAYSLFIAQNYGAGREDRVNAGTKKALLFSGIFCLLISCIVFWKAEELIGIFVKNSSVDIIKTGAVYLRIEGACYIGIGFLFLFYGYFRGIQKAYMSLILTVISLGTRVFLAYTLSSIPAVGVAGIWISIPIGWLLADVTGIWQIKKRKTERK